MGMVGVEARPCRLRAVFAAVPAAVFPEAEVAA